MFNWKHFYKLSSVLFVSQTFDSDGKLIEEPTMQALEVFCSCWFTFEVRWLKLSMLWAVLLCTKNSLGLIFEVVYKGISHACQWEEKK